MKYLIYLALFSMPALAQPDNDWVKKSVANDWVWFEDYAFLYSEYTVFCEEGCECEVGMGMSFLGEPRGEKKRYSGRLNIFTIGAGAVHIRRASGNSECLAGLAPGENRVFSVTITNLTIIS